jgi:hypothetical protein
VHSPNKLNDLKMAEKNLHFQKGLANLKVQFYEKIEWGILPGLVRTKNKCEFLAILPQKNSLYSLGECT